MKVLAIVFLIFFIWFATPHIMRGEWFAPTAGPSDHWAYEYAAPGTKQLLATPPEGYGVFRFDFWNTPPTSGRSVVKNDFRLEKFWQ
ncbi:hypothetical protein K2Q02_00720 [Patescibacteria group bacterium]|nr:hypothetical protein [Patescibacteria group bacterium]